MAEISTIATIETGKETLNLQQKDGLAFLSEVSDGSVDLILTDPPYIISKESGMNSHYDKVKEQEASGVTYIKSEEEWESFRKKKRFEG